MFQSVVLCVSKPVICRILDVKFTGVYPGHCGLEKGSPRELILGTLGCRYYHCPTERLWLWFCASACRNSATFPVPQWQSGWALSHRLRRHDGPRWFCIDRKHFGLWRQGLAELTCGGWEGVGAIEAPQIILEQRPTEHWPKPCLFGVYRGLYYPVGCFFMAQLSLFNPLDPTACFFLKFPFPLKLTLTFCL